MNIQNLSLAVNKKIIFKTLKYQKLGRQYQSIHRLKTR